MKTQRGIGLLELMVAMTIGLFLLLGLSAIFVSTQQTNTLNQKLQSLQDNQRMATWLLSTGIHNAGYFPASTANYDKSLQFQSSTPFAAGQVLSGATNAGVDTVKVRFVASQSIQGCSTSYTAGDIYEDTFSVSGGYLVCDETDKTSGVANSTVKLIAGVSTMTALYGVATDGGDSVTKYLNATDVTNGSYWPSVKTVTVALQFTNPLYGQTSNQPSTLSMKQTMMVGGS